MSFQDLSVRLAGLVSKGAIQEYHVQPGPDPLGEQVAAAVVLGSMTDVPCDAYVVPEFQNCMSPGGVGGAIARAGAGAGMMEYDSYLKTLGGRRQAWGEATVTGSGGGRSNNLIHVVSVGSGDTDAELRTAALSTGAALNVADDYGMNTVVFPALGTGVIGRLNDGQSARAIFGATFAFWRETSHKPREVIVAIYGNRNQYQAFRDVLRAGVVTQDAARVQAGEEKKFDPARWLVDVTGGMETEDWLRGKK